MGQCVDSTYAGISTEESRSHSYQIALLLWMEGKESIHISRVGRGIQSLQPLALELRDIHVRSLCLHANSISRLEGLRTLRGLEDLNLSSNQLGDIEGLQTLTSLTSLNFASNRLSSLDKLQPLSELQSLTASYNNIEHLSCLSTLQVIDLAVGCSAFCAHLCQQEVPPKPFVLHAPPFLTRWPQQYLPVIHMPLFRIVKNIARFAGAEEAGSEGQCNWISAGACSSCRAAQPRRPAAGRRMSREQRLCCARIQVPVHALVPGDEPEYPKHAAPLCRSVHMSCQDWDACHMQCPTAGQL